MVTRNIERKGKAVSRTAKKQGPTRIPRNRILHFTEGLQRFERTGSFVLFDEKGNRLTPKLVKKEILLKFFSSLGNEIHTLLHFEISLKRGTYWLFRGKHGCLRKINVTGRGVENRGAIEFLNYLHGVVEGRESGPLSGRDWGLRKKFLENQEIPKPVKTYILRWYGIKKSRSEKA